MWQEFHVKHLLYEPFKAHWLLYVPPGLAFEQVGYVRDVRHHGLCISHTVSCSTGTPSVLNHACCITCYQHCLGLSYLYAKFTGRT